MILKSRSATVVFLFLDIQKMPYDVRKLHAKLRFKISMHYFVVNSLLCESFLGIDEQEITVVLFDFRIVVVRGLKTPFDGK